MSLESLREGPLTSFEDLREYIGRTVSCAQIRKESDGTTTIVSTVSSLPGVTGKLFQGPAGTYYVRKGESDYYITSSNFTARQVKLED